MINDILDASKLKNKKMELNVNVGNLKKEVNKVVYSLKAAKDMSSGNSLVADRVALRNDVAEGLPNVKADLHRLSQVLYNLVGNVSLTPIGFTPPSSCFSGRGRGRGRGWLSSTLQIVL